MDDARGITPPTAKDVAELAGVSRSTVSNYLHRAELVHADTRERIRSAIEQLRYVPNESARGLRSGFTRIIALSLLDAWTPFYSDFSRGVESTAVRDGWTVLFSNTDRDEVRERTSLEIFEAHRVRGLIIVPEGDVTERLVSMRARGIQSVTVEQPLASPGIPNVRVDDRRGGQIAAHHLLAGGHRRIAFIGDPDKVIHVKDRWEGFCGVLAGSSANVSLVPADLSMTGGVKAAMETFGRPAAEWPDAVFAANDLVGIGFLQGCLARGVTVPSQVAIVGFDDIDFAAQAAVPLTTIRQPAREMGIAAASTLLAMINGGVEDQPVAERVFIPSLVVRESAP